MGNVRNVLFVMCDQLRADWQASLKYRVTVPESLVREFKVREGKSGVLIGHW